MKRRLWKSVFLYFFATLVALYFFAPLGWLAMASVQKESDLLSIKSQLIPSKLTGINYLKLIAGKQLEGRNEEGGVRSYSVPNEAKLFPQAIANSFIVSLAVTLICLFFGSLTAYSVTRLSFPWRSALFFGILGTRMIPTISLAVPFFLLFQKIGLIDNKIGLIIVYCSFTLPYIVWILCGFFASVPSDLEEAARIDGCTRMSALWRIIFPLAVPGFVAAGIFSFMQTWNEFFFALILSNSENAFTVPVISGMFGTELDIDYTLMITSGVLTVIPPLFFVFLFQKFIVQGLTAGGVKS